MKKEPTYNNQLDEVAVEAMKCLINSTFSHPAIMQQMDEIAVKNNRSLSQEIAHRSYALSAIMLQVRKEYLKTVKDGDN